MDGKYVTKEDQVQPDENEQYEAGLFITSILDDIGTIPCKLSDLAEDEQCPDSNNLDTILNAVSFEFSGDKTPARTFQSE